MTTIESYSQGAPCYVELVTPDTESAKTFYSALFGWNLNDVNTSTEGTYTTASVGDARVAGISGQMPELSGHPAFWGIYLATDDVDTTCAQVEAAGGTIEMAPMDVMGMGRMAAIQDPTGARVNLWQGGSNIGTSVRGVTGAPIWNELVTPDLEKDKTFYHDVLGVTWETQSMEGMQYTVMCSSDGSQCAGAFTPGDDMADMPPHWNLFLDVDDVDATISKAQELGGRPLAPAFDVPTVGRMAMLADPQGGMFWVMAPDLEMVTASAS